MIVVDASALVAILLEEPEATRFREFLLASPAACLSPVGYWEAATRLHGVRGKAGVVELDVVIDNLRIVIAPATARTSRLACEAERTFGKRTSARLNLGDCFAYALARELDAPLLYKGDDFNQTDIRRAVTG
jgi:ribonuclease VapC